MSEHERKRYNEYQLFDQPTPRYEQPRVLQETPATNTGRFTAFYPANYPRQRQVFHEYSLWGSSNGGNPVVFPRPITSSVFNQRPRFPFCPPIQINLQPDEEQMPQMPPMPQIPMVSLDAVTENDSAGKSEDVEIIELEEPEKKIIERQELYAEDSDCEEIPDSIEQSSNSSGSSGDWTYNNFQRAGVSFAYPWASRPARINNRGTKSNVVQRRLVKALSQPVKMDKGASMMQRMGWMGGGLGRDEAGIVVPVTPNAVYATTTVGFGQDLPPPPKSKNSAGMLRKFRAKNNKNQFRTNILKMLLAFICNDRSSEIYFDKKLMSSERKRIHRMVAAIEGNDDMENLNIRQQEVLDEINARKRYLLATESEGEGKDRQICVYKTAPEHVYVVTPDDCGPCLTDIVEVEEEINPFLKSITNHIKEEQGSILKAPEPYLLDKVIELFIEFCEDDDFTEFRFLGPFTEKEIHVINNFIVLITDLTNKQKPNFKVPIELLDVFTKGYRYDPYTDLNNYTSITKVHYNLKQEFFKQEEEKQRQRMDPIRGNQ